MDVTVSLVRVLWEEMSRFLLFLDHCSFSMPNIFELFFSAPYSGF